MAKAVLTPSTNELFDEYSLDRTTELSCLRPKQASLVAKALSESSNDEDSRRAEIALSEHCERMAKKADYWLSRLSPEILLNASGIHATVKSSSLSRLGVGFALGQKMWTIGVAGGGEDTTMASLCEYLESATRWVSGQLLLSEVSQVDNDLPQAIRNNPYHENIRRMNPVDIRMSWANEMICRTIADEVEKIIEHSSGAEIISSTSVKELMKWVRSGIKSMDRSSEKNEPWNPHNPPRAAVALAEALSVSSGSLGSQGFVKCMHSALSEEKPLLKLGNRTMIPITFRELSTKLDMTLMQLLQDRVSNQKDRADLFESVVRSLLAKLLPGDLSVPQRGVSIPGGPNKEDGETDFVIFDKSNKFIIGECKAGSVPSGNKSVMNNFTTTIGYGIDQVSKRIGWLNQAGKIVIDDQVVHGPKGTAGLIVPIHPYATAAYAREVLSQEQAVDDVHVIPLHQLVLVARAFESSEEMWKYLEFRNQLLQLNVKILDEMDILMQFLHGKGRLDEMLANFPDGRAMILAYYSIEVSDVYEFDEPTSAASWKNYLVRNAINVGRSQRSNL